MAWLSIPFVTEVGCISRFTFGGRFRILKETVLLGGALMVHVLVRHKVADYNRWKQAFDSHLNMRKHAGETAFRVFHTVDDPRDVVLFFDWESVEQARKFMNSDELRKAMQQAGVEGATECQKIGAGRRVH